VETDGQTDGRYQLLVTFPANAVGKAAEQQVIKLPNRQTTPTRPTTSDQTDHQTDH